MTKTKNEPNKIQMKSIAEQLGIEERIVKNKYISGRSNSITGLGADALLDDTISTTQIIDESITTAKILDDSVTDDKMDYPRWYQEIARTTLTVAGDTITVSSIPARQYLKIVLSVVASGGTTDTTFRFNNDSGTNYALIQVAGMAAGGAAITSATGFGFESGATDSGSVMWGEVEVLNILAEEKMFKAWAISGDATGGATAPTVIEEMGKWSNTSAQINRVDLTNAGTGDFAIGSEIIVLGHD